MVFKRYILIFVILFVFFNCKEDKKVRSQLVSIQGKYCKYPDNGFLALPYQLYTNESLIKNDTIWYMDEVQLIELSPGDYTIKYESIYDREEVIDFEITNETQNIDLCIDIINYESIKSPLLVNQLPAGGVLKIDFTSSGCFHNEKLSMKIVRKKNQYIMKYGYDEFLLSKEQLELFKEFEVELRTIQSGWCTTRDTYQLTLNKNFDTLLLIDESCQWNGFKNLVAKLESK